MQPHIDYDSIAEIYDRYVTADYDFSSFLSEAARTKGRILEVMYRTLVASGFEQGGHPLVKRLQLFEFFGPAGQLLWRRLLAMQFTFIEKDAFEHMAYSTGFRVAALYGNYDRTTFEPLRSHVMIWVLEKH
ncbi:MAG: hypothetical protein ACMUIA_05325 [bacterium]